jgi:type VI secretion system protein ImpC
MPPTSSGRGDVGLSVGVPLPSGEAAKKEPFRILLLGDFSGRGSRGLTQPLAGRKPLRLDPDNVEQAPAKVGVELRLPVGPGLTVKIAELDDFRPEHLLARLDLFEALRDLRRQAEDPRAFLQKGAPVPPPPPPSAAPAPTATDPGAMLDELMAQTETAARQTGVGAGWQSYLQRLVKPLTAPRTDEARQKEALAQIDEAIGNELRGVLHQPHFQAVEAAWRGARLLVRKLDPDEEVQVWLLDVTKAELLADLSEPATLARLLVEPSPAAPPGRWWGVLAGQYTFAPTRDDLVLLSLLGAVAQKANAPFLAGAAPVFVGVAEVSGRPDPRTWRPRLPQELAEAWLLVRQLPESAYVGLALPRFLLRLPYGKRTVRVEGFDFEEQPTPPRHGDYLWGCPSLAAALLLGQSFRRSGWSLRPGQTVELDGLPQHVYEADDEPEVKPTAEAWLNDGCAGVILSEGLMPVLSVANRDAVQVPVFRAIAEPERTIAGRWRS